MPAASRKRDGLRQRKTASHSQQRGERGTLHWRSCCRDMDWFQYCCSIRAGHTGPHWSNWNQILLLLFQWGLQDVTLPTYWPCWFLRWKPSTSFTFYSPCRGTSLAQAGFSVTTLISSLLNHHDLFLDSFSIPFFQSPASVHSIHQSDHLIRSSFYRWIIKFSTMYCPCPSILCLQFPFYHVPSASLAFTDAMFWKTG